MESTGSHHAVSDENQHYSKQNEIINSADAPPAKNEIGIGVPVVNADQTRLFYEVNTQWGPDSSQVNHNMVHPSIMNSEAPIVALAIPVVPQQPPTSQIKGKSPCNQKEVGQGTLTNHDRASPPDKSVLRNSKQPAGHDSGVSDMEQFSGLHSPELHPQLAVQTSVEKNSADYDVTKPLTNEAYLHGASPQGGPRRVGKSQKKAKAPAITASLRPQGSNVRSAIEQNFENLRVSLIAEQFRREHEHKTSTEHHEALVASLREEIRSQDHVVAEWKDKHERLGQELLKVKTQAQRHSLYAEGLGKDYGKLKKSVSKTLEENEKILREKISEVENEREDLREHFEKALEKWSKYQKNMSLTIGDLSLQLTASQLARKGHVESLREQEKILQKEQTKHDALETNLLATMQAMQHQLGENSTVLMSKMEHLQSLVKTAATTESHDPCIKECLTSINKLRTTPFLTVKEVQKAEESLGLLHKRYLVCGDESDLVLIIYQCRGRISFCVDVRRE